jgi:hypothetical protein
MAQGRMTKPPSEDFGTEVANDGFDFGKFRQRQRGYGLTVSVPVIVVWMAQ